MNTLKNYIFVLVSLLLFAACGEEKQKMTEDRIEEFSINLRSDTLRISKTIFEENKLGFTHPVQESTGSTITSTGMIEVPPNGRAVISAKVGGYIKNSQLLIGDQVEKGDFLVSIENIEFLELQQKYLETMQELVFLESNYQRQLTLYNEKISSEKSYLKAQSDFKRVSAIYTGLKKKLELLNISTDAVENGNFTEKSNIYAPISGDITEINVKTGSYVSTSDPIMEIVNTEHVHLELKIFEKDALEVKKGQKVIFRLPESSERSYAGEVHLIGKSIGADRTVTAHVHIEQEDDTDFIPGMFVQAEIVKEDRASVFISKTAVVRSDDQYYLFKMLREGKNFYLFQKIEVSPGMEYQDKIELANKVVYEKNDRYLTGIKSY
ncbi:efflux RND transporter periplasmic adaptor subunit [Lutimonas sp.]|uniref:efflux RND transporter periplasmic adaptor subunit n=1 Tax=Lutimonas sp. TaxID=1872403 RepID=UPI003D9BA9D5